MVAAMDQSDKFQAIMALRAFVRDLPADQAHLFHRIATRFQAYPIEFRDTVLQEFSELGRRPSMPVDDLEIYAQFSYALGRQTSAVPTMVEQIQFSWPNLQPMTREAIVTAIKAAIDAGRAGGDNFAALWNVILTHAEATAEKRVGIDELRAQAAQEAYQNYDFGSAVIEDHSGWEHGMPADEWTRPIFVQPEDSSGPTEKGHFFVKFVMGTAIVQECYGMLNGNVLGPAPSPSPPR
jgi:hypothetical protein